MGKEYKMNKKAKEKLTKYFRENGIDPKQPSIKTRRVRNKSRDTK